jgi:periplasmic mercuric ion binding protein
MKNIIVLLISLLAFSVKAQNNTVKTVTIHVSGNCEECKERIENAADIKGVKLSKWDTKTKIAKVTYDTTKTSLLKIEEAIAAKGYDAGPVKATQSSYMKLPKCCRYRDGKCEEK